MTRRPFLVVHGPINTPPRPEKSPVERGTYVPPPKPSPLTFAQHWLGSRLEERGELGAYLEGRPVKLDALMREANRVAHETGAEMLLYKPEWKP